MKKIYILLLLFVPFITRSQTITQADLPVAGTGWTTANDSTYGASIPAGGTGQVWNFNNLQNLYPDTVGFQDPAGTPYASTFPTSNLFGYDQSNGGYTYFTSNSTGLYVDGIAGSGTNVQYNPPLLYIPVPFSYGDTRSNLGRFQIDTAIVDTSGTTQNIRFVIRIDSQFDADGSGSLDIPTGNYPSVLRVKVTQIVTDSIYLQLFPGVYLPVSGTSTQNVSYRFFTTGLQVNYLLGIEADSLGTTATSSEYYVGPVGLSVQNVKQNKQSVSYPNPAMNYVNFKVLDENSTVIVYDNSGNEVINVKSVAGKSINTEALATGLYHYKIINNRTGLTDNGSFVIQR